jgi:hypothetical protein
MLLVMLRALHVMTQSKAKDPRTFQKRSKNQAMLDDWDFWFEQHNIHKDYFITHSPNTEV